MSPRSRLAVEARQLFRLSIPVIIAQIGGMTMGLVDSMVVGSFSSIELAGVAAGNSIFWALAMVGYGLLGGMDPIVAGAHGTNETEKADRCLGAALQIGMIFTLIVTPLLWFSPHILGLIDSTPEVIRAATPFLQTMTFSLGPLIFYGALARYWQAFEIVAPFTLTVILANVLNWGVNVVLVPGGMGFEALGAVGAGIATLACRVFMLAAAVWIACRLWKKRTDRPAAHLWGLMTRIDRPMLGSLMKLGIPASLEVMLEVFAFSLVTLIVTRLGAQQLATHHIVLSIASFAFMFPLGFGSATAVRVGYHRGRQDPDRAFSAGWLGIAFSFGIMAFSSLILTLFPEHLLGFFTNDPEVIALAVQIIVICAMFQVFDGIQTSAAGALRGLGDTRTAMLANLCAHYGFGLPVGFWLGFHLEYGLWGLWVGLALGLMVTATFNTVFWWRKGKKRTPILSP